MRRIFTSTIFAAALLVASFHSFAQCGPVYDNFNTGGTDGFTASGTGTSGLSNSGSNLKLSNVSAGTITFTTPTLHLPTTTATTIDYGFTYGTTGNANVTNLTVAVKYVNTSGQVVTTTPQSISTTSPICNTIAVPSDIITTGYSAYSYQLVFTFTTTGNGNSGTTITIDDYRTSSTNAAAALPVKFSSLDARAMNNAVSLQWNVATETDLNGYNIEKSSDGRNYSNIGFVNATGASSYSFVDTKPYSITYYRIKSVDINGKYTYSTIAMVKAGKAMIILKAFPTPFIKNVSIQHGTATVGALITISSEDGRTVKSIIPSVGTQQTDIDLSSAKAGMYLVRYANGNGEVETLKILKQQ